MRVLRFEVSTGTGTKFLTEGGGGGAAGGNQTLHQAGPLTYELRRTLRSAMLRFAAYLQGKRYPIEGFF